MKKIAVWMMLIGVLLLAGCSDPAEKIPAEPAPQDPPPAEKPVEQPVPVEMTELQKAVGEYEVAVKEKLAELDVLKEKVQEIPVKEVMSEQAEVIKGAMEDVADSLGEMMEELADNLKDLSESAGGQ